jgi:hypothetical protein
MEARLLNTEDNKSSANVSEVAGNSRMKMQGVAKLGERFQRPSPKAVVQRFSGFSQPRQCGEEVLRILVTGGPPGRHAPAHQDELALGAGVAHDWRGISRRYSRLKEPRRQSKRRSKSSTPERLKRNNGSLASGTQIAKQSGR